MKHRPHSNENKKLSIAGLLSRVRKAFTEIDFSAQRTHRDRKISIPDCLMSALAMFSLKSPSLLSFSNGRAEPIVAKNIKTLFKVPYVPSDTYMREILDEVEPQSIRSAYLDVFHEIQRGKLLERYEFLDGQYLCLVDGSEIFYSEQVHCKNCCKKEHRDGRTTYHHQILGAVLAKPGLRQVLPLCPEPILKQDGITKNDCEQNALTRFLHDVKREHPRLKLTMVSDALSANAQHIHALRSFGYGFIIVVKPTGNRSLYEHVQGITQEVTQTVDRNTYTFRYVNHVPINETKEAPIVNFIECVWVEMDGKRQKTGGCAWVVDQEINPDNLYQLMCGGRTRWKVENETFNTLKNQGYQFEHNFGHGKKNLHTVFALLMMLAFLLDQVQEAACGLFQAAMTAMLTRRAFWERMRSFFHIYLIHSWSDLFTAMSRRTSFLGVSLPLDTS